MTPSIRNSWPLTALPEYHSKQWQNHLLGIRGILAIQSFLFVFFQTFLAAAVVDSKNTIGPLYQIVLRKTLSVLFWNEPLIYSFIIFLSARTVCIPYLNVPDRATCSSTLFRRGIRLWIPTFVAFSLSAAAFSTTSTAYISNFLRITNNQSTTTPKPIPNFLVYLNSLFNIFWTTRDYSSQAANKSFPSGTLWIVSLLFQQSYTVYMTMIIVPYTRPAWRVKVLIIFILAAWWVQSWAWYSISGLLLADIVHNMDFRRRAASGLRMGQFTIPLWPLCLVLIFVGVLLQYLFIAWRPQYRNAEMKGHTGLYNSGPFNEGVDFEQPLPRGDSYLIILGLMLLVETYRSVQQVLRNRFLAWLGRRSFSLFLIQPLIIYTAGIALYMRMNAAQVRHEAATFVSFMICLPLTVSVAEILYRGVDVASVIVGRKIWAWLKE